MSSTLRIKMGLLPLLYLVTNISFAGGQMSNQLSNSFAIPQPQDIRDPFTPSPLMFEVMGKQSVGGGAYGFMRSPTESVPKMRLRGFVTHDEKDPIALLEVAGVRTFLVHEGDEINIDPAQPLSVIRITKITRLSVTVETGRLGAIRVQR